jgi:hypothetical protein
MVLSDSYVKFLEAIFPYISPLSPCSNVAPSTSPTQSKAPYVDNANATQAELFSEDDNSEVARSKATGESSGWARL